MNGKRRGHNDLFKYSRNVGTTPYSHERGLFGAAMHSVAHSLGQSGTHATHEAANIARKFHKKLPRSVLDDKRAAGLHGAIERVKTIPQRARELKQNFTSGNPRDVMNAVAHEFNHWARPHATLQTDNAVHDTVVEPTIDSIGLKAKEVDDFLRKKTTEFNLPPVEGVHGLVSDVSDLYAKVKDNIQSRDIFSKWTELPDSAIELDSLDEVISKENALKLVEDTTRKAKQDLLLKGNHVIKRIGTAFGTFENNYKIPSDVFSDRQGGLLPLHGAPLNRHLNYGGDVAHSREGFHSAAINRHVEVID